MALRSGHTFVGRALRDAGVDTIFFLAGGPLSGSIAAAEREGIRVIDFHHEQAAAMAAHAYARVTGKPGVCGAAAGPGVTNLVTGVYNANVDGVPLVVLGGAYPTSTSRRGQFQELDQVTLMQAVTKWADRAYTPSRIPELMAMAFRAAVGLGGPAYLDLPADVLFARIDEEEVPCPRPDQYTVPGRAKAADEDVQRAIDLLAQAERPVVVAGSGVWWSRGYDALRRFVERCGVPFFTTPLGRGAIPEDHELCYPGARAKALREADYVLVAGTRLNFMMGYGAAPRFNPDAKFVRIDLNRTEFGLNRAIDVALLGDAKCVLEQLTQALPDGGLMHRWTAWRDALCEKNKQREGQLRPLFESDQVPIHHYRLFKEVREVLPRNAILTVDGHETLNFARQSIPTYEPGHRMNSGVSGCIGSAVPFGLGAKAGRPDCPVVVLTGDGSFGMNGIEVETALRHKLDLVVVIDNNLGWAAAIQGRHLPGRDLPLIRYDRVVQELGGHGEFVERPEDIRPALERAFAAGGVAVVNVLTDKYLVSETMPFSGY